MGLFATLVVAVVLACLITILVGGVLFLSLKVCTDDRLDEIAHRRGPPTLLKYFLHEHPILSLLWSRPMYPHEVYYLNRIRRLLILFGVFLINFIVVALIALQVPPFPDCAQTQEAFDGCREDGLSCALVDTPDCSSGNCNFLVGFNPGLKQFQYEDTGSVVFEKYHALAIRNDDLINEEKPCFTYCLVNDTQEEITGELYRRVTDYRRGCSEYSWVQATSLVCYAPYFTSGNSVCDAGVLFALSPIEFGIRLVAVVTIVLPMSFLLKKLFRCTALSRGCVGCCKKFLGYPIIAALIVASAFISIVMALTLQGEVIGDFTITFLTSFIIGLFFEFPKLAILYYGYKRAILVRQWKEYDQKFDSIVPSELVTEGPDANENTYPGQRSPPSVVVLPEEDERGRGRALDPPPVNRERSPHRNPATGGITLAAPLDYVPSTTPSPRSSSPLMARHEPERSQPISAADVEVVVGNGNYDSEVYVPMRPAPASQ